MQDTSLVAIFLTGLFTGGLTCMAVQGGLLAATIAQREEEMLKEKAQKTGHALPIISFIFAKIIAYTILGLLLGWFGSFFDLSLTARVIMQFTVVIFMLATALNILNVHPFFRYFVIQPPKFLTRLIRQESKSSALFAPGILGALTVFIPCGTTQAMMVLAIGSANPILGAAILFVYTLGTSPIFFILGYCAARLGGLLQSGFMKAAAYGIILLALFNLNAAIALTGSGLTFDNLLSGVNCAISFCNVNASVESASTVKSEETINIENYGYSPANFSVKAGSPVTLRLVNNSGGGCQQAFTIPQLGIQKVVPLGRSDTLKFTAPKEIGQLAFMCSMGMFRGVINII